MNSDNPTNSSNSSLNINEASKVCGLSPSVLRIWELRYGWPAPKRKPNGYRAYNLHQVQELKRAADLVRNGTPISALIIDGLPRWPTDHSRAPQPRALTRTRSLPRPANPAHAEMQRNLIESLETRRGFQVKEHLQRIIWSARPADEPLMALVPIVIALAEHRRAERELPDGEDIATQVRQRSLQILRLLRVSESPLWVWPATAGDQTLAALVAVILTLRHIPAQPWTAPGQLAEGAWIAVSDGDFGDGQVSGERLIGRLTTLGGSECPSLSLLMDQDQPVPFGKLVEHIR